MAMGLPIAQAFIWIGAMLQGIAHGQVTYDGWAWDLPDAYGVVLPRTPVQIVGAAAALLIWAFLFTLAWRRAQYEGAVFATFLLADSLVQFVLGFARGDATAMLGPLRAAQLVHLAGAMVAITLLLTWRSLAQKRERDEDVNPETAALA
jgi:prolipoprotein diacylglyceryltransferase